MSTGGQVDAVPVPGESTRDESAPVASAVMTAVAVCSETRSPQEICTAYGSDFVPPEPLDKVAVALNTLGQLPLNARRVSPERGICGWYIWGGDGGGGSRTPGFFQTLPVAHLLERCPQVMPFLALAPGWRVRLAKDGPEITPPHDVSPPDNVAVRRIGARISRSPSVNQWVWLSILLHLLAIVLFGDTTGGGARSGEHRGARSAGPLNVTLQGPVDRVADAPLALRADTRLRIAERRESAPPSRTTKDSAPVGSVSSSPPNAAKDTPPTPVMPPLIATEVEKPMTNFVVPINTREPIAPPEPPAVRLPPTLLPTLPRLDAIVPPKAIDPPKIERDIALPTELIPRLAPLVPARTELETTPPVEAVPRLKTFVPPRVEPDTVVPPVEIPRMAPLAPPQVAHEILRPAELLPRLAPVTPAPAIEAAKPTEFVPRLAQPAAAVTDRATEPARAPPPTTPSAPVTAAPATALPSTSRVAPGVPGGTGAVGDAATTLTPRGVNVAPAAPGSRPRIDLDAVRQRAREIDREGSGPRTLLPFIVKPREEFKTKEQQAFDKALKRPDCRDAYSGMGLAAVVPLLWDAVSEKGCKW